MADGGDSVAWDLESDLSPGDFLIGHLEGRWKGDTQSIEYASAALLTATFARAGLDAEEAVDKAYDYLERGATLALEHRDGETHLTFEFEQDSGSSSGGGRG